MGATGGTLGGSGGAAAATGGALGTGSGGAAAATGGALGTGSGGAVGATGGALGTGSGGAAAATGGAFGGTGGGFGGCPQAGVLATPTTIAGVRTALARNWVLCSPLGLFNKPQDGLSITTSDRFAFLMRDSSGVLTPQHGVDFEGGVSYLAVDPVFGGAIQVNYTIDLGGTIISRAVITADPTMLIINNNGVFEYRYVPADPS